MSEEPRRIDPVDMQTVAIGRTVKALREGRGWTQQSLAEATRLALTTITQMEAGKKADPRASTLIALSRVFGVPVDQLLTPPPEGPASSTRKPSRRKKGGA
jgi:transcriptional regulator with XRE-family HTH domain